NLDSDYYTAKPTLWVQKFLQSAIPQPFQSFKQIRALNSDHKTPPIRPYETVFNQFEKNSLLQSAQLENGRSSGFKFDFKLDSSFMQKWLTRFQFAFL
ncbi:hypothetical protein CHH80_11605, partial [Bacillus sp. 7504-2]